MEREPGYYEYISVHQTARRKRDLVYIKASVSNEIHLSL